jgi:hypothetical protein
MQGALAGSLATIVAAAVILALLPVRLCWNETASPPRLAAGQMVPFLDAETGFVAPMIGLAIKDPRREAEWSKALAGALKARNEVSVSHGRVDVLSDVYAIEVDWLHKWHEGLGQAVHYGLETGKTPALALIIPTSQWPLDAGEVDKLRIVERAALKAQVKLLLLRQIPGEGRGAR